MDDIRRKKIEIRVSIVEKYEIESKAIDANISVSDLIRKSVNQVNIVKKNTGSKKMHEQLMRQISAIGNNLNQIAHYVNTNKKIDHDVLCMLAAVEHDLDKLITN